MKKGTFFFFFVTTEVLNNPNEAVATVFTFKVTDVQWGLQTANWAA